MEFDNYLVELIQEAAQKAFTKLLSEHNERFYYYSLITTDNALCPCIAAWSYEALDNAINDKNKDYIKWDIAESPYYAFAYEEYFGNVEKVFNDRMEEIESRVYGERFKVIGDEGEIDKEIELRLNSMEEAMRNLDKKGFFDKNMDRTNVVVSVEIIPPEYSNTERTIRLNPREAIEEWLEEAESI
ncbi:MAG: DUF4303 domain-containing protein [Lachnospiraceae bacterium]|nr:DUF4303 domain-containing protein [Lachnospiraceae bacterium]